MMEANLTLIKHKIIKMLEKWLLLYFMNSQLNSFYLYNIWKVRAASLMKTSTKLQTWQTYHVRQEGRFKFYFILILEWS